MAIGEMMKRTSLLSLAVFVAACSSGRADVDVDGIDDFGWASTAYWMDYDPQEYTDVWSISDGVATLQGQGALDPLAILDYGFSCRELEKELAEISDASDALVAALGEDGAVSGACDEMTALYDVESDWAQRRPAQRHRIGGYYFGPEDTTVPEAGTYDESSFGAYVSYIDDPGNCGVWDPDACEFLPDGGGCDDSYEGWNIEDVTLEIARSAFNVVGTLEGTLESYEDDEEVGEIRADFSAAVCEITAPTAMVFW
jgi:hypothetical protein